MSATEGTRRIVEEVYTRRRCDECGEPATQRHTYLRHNARNNRGSRGYGRDDLTYCSDRDVHTCDSCRAPELEGYDWMATFGGTKYPHMLLYWQQVRATEHEPGKEDHR